MKQNIGRIGITAGIIIGGILLILYPFVSNYLYEHQQEQIIFNYTEEVNQMDEQKQKEALDRARQYNEALGKSAVVLTDPFDEEAFKSDVLNEYSGVLNVYGDGIMGYIEIPKISVFLPIYHGTEARTLEEGIGHLENTSLPIGGEGTHCVLSGHTGLSDKRLFTDLEMLEKGDCFYIQVLGEHLAYRVDQILVVEPQETEALRITEGKDYLTLVTCTPYGVNSHRLLVRGVRVPYEPEQKEAAGEEKVLSKWMRQYVSAVLSGILLLLIFLFVLRMIRRKGSKI